MPTALKTVCFKDSSSVSQKFVDNSNDLSKSVFIFFFSNTSRFYLRILIGFELILLK